MYFPDTWVILKITEKATNGVHYRVLGGWYGGYLNGDSWKINSGITQIRAGEKTYSFVGESGSVYNCDKKCERLSNLTGSVLKTYMAAAEKPDSLVSLEMVGVAEVLNKVEVTNEIEL